MPTMMVILLKAVVMMINLGKVCKCRVKASLVRIPVNLTIVISITLISTVLQSVQSYNQYNLTISTILQSVQSYRILPCMCCHPGRHNHRIQTSLPPIVWLNHPKVREHCFRSIFVTTGQPDTSFVTQVNVENCSMNKDVNFWIFHQNLWQKVGKGWEK